jgi:DNA-directed RNA polymerase alpha subunit
VGKIQTLGDLIRLTEEELMQVPNLGKKTVKEIQESLAENGFSLCNSKPLIHSAECWSWGPLHYECACRQIALLKGYVK